MRGLATTTLPEAPFPNHLLFAAIRRVSRGRLKHLLKAGLYLIRPWFSQSSIPKSKTGLIPSESAR